MKRISHSCVAALIAILAALVASGQEKTHREWYQEGLEAAKAGDMAASAAALEKALEINPYKINRPFFQYHLARALAAGGNRERAYSFLRDAWDEGIESFVIFQAARDPLFGDVSRDAEWIELRRLAAELRLEVTELGNGLWQIDGTGASILAHLDSSGWLLVDTGYPEASAALLRTLDEIAPGHEVETIVNTHGHEDHIGGNFAFPRATIFAHPRTLEMMRAPEPLVPGVPIDPKPDSALPDVLVDGPVSIRRGSETVRVFPLPTHSGSDLVVAFDRAGVIHLGDDYFPDTSARIFPGADAPSFFEMVDRIFQASPSLTTVVTGHSTNAPIAKLRTAISNTKEIYDFVNARLAAGDDLETILETGEAKGYPADWLRHFAGSD